MKSVKTIFFALFFLPLFAFADTNSPNFVGLENPIRVDTICQALKLFLNVILTLAVPVAVLFLVYAGFLFVWARGSKDGLAHAKRNFLYTVIGIGIFMGAWVLGQIIANTLNQLGGSVSPSQQIGQCK